MVKNSLANAGDVRLIPASGRSPGEGNATHSRILACRIPWTEEPGGRIIVRKHTHTCKSSSHGTNNNFGEGNEECIFICLIYVILFYSYYYISKQRR